MFSVHCDFSLHLDSTSFDIHDVISGEDRGNAPRRRRLVAHFSRARSPFFACHHHFRTRAKIERARLAPGADGGALFPRGRLCVLSLRVRPSVGPSSAARFSICGARIERAVPEMIPGLSSLTRKDMNIRRVIKDERAPG